jgi:hypothetical protein
VRNHGEVPLIVSLGLPYAGNLPRYIQTDGKDINLPRNIQTDKTDITRYITKYI